LLKLFLEAHASGAIRNNQIEVLPLLPADGRIRLAVYVATYGQPDLNQYALLAVPPSISS
jgi:hypothetical protein